MGIREVGLVVMVIVFFLGTVFWGMSFVLLENFVFWVFVSVVVRWR